MTITGVLSVALVSDHAAAVEWYEKLLGRPADAHPMPSLADWHISETAWVQVFHDPDRAGSSVFNLAVDNVDAHIADIADKGISAGEVFTNDKGSRLATVTDPDGNTITLIENPVK